MGRERVAQAVGVHPSHLSRLLRQHCGSTFQALLAGARLNCAEARLRSSDDAIEVIARSCGFTDRSHLIRHFKARHGLTPTAWRRQLTGSGSASAKDE
ncbi:MAG: helix-turn-helix transcriptional regulator [Planctomycetota bacterium]